jgi:predicted O-methyltransferase YrrM
MSSRHLPINDALIEYIRSVSPPEPDLLRRLRDETAAEPLAVMQITPEQGAFMGVLMRLLNAHRTIEVGVFTGYSALCVAMALPEDGRIIACDVSEPWTAVARRYWREAGVDHKIDLRLQPAVRTLDELLDGGGASTFDFAFIDADKVSYAAYYERCLQLVRPGRLIAVDNTLWSGRVADAAVIDEDTVALRRFNEALAVDERVRMALLPMGDGLTLAVKR